MILTGNLYKCRVSVGDSIKPPMLIAAGSPSEADAEATMFWADQEDYTGEPIRIVTLTEIDTAAL